MTVATTECIFSIFNLGRLERTCRNSDAKTMEIRGKLANFSPNRLPANFRDHNPDGPDFQNRPGAVARKRTLGPQHGGTRIVTSEIHAGNGCLDRPSLRHFNQLHLSVAGTMQDVDFTFAVAEDKDIPIAEVSFFNGFFQCHGAQGNGLVGTNKMDFGGLGNLRKLVHHYGDGSAFGSSDNGQ